MRVEVDQSGKVEDLNTHTVVAYSNDLNGAILIRAGAKQKIVSGLRKSITDSSELYATFFAVLVYILVKDLKASVFVIDEEYTGKEKLISETIRKLFWVKKKKTVDLRFTPIGRHSNAHQVAWRTHLFKGKKFPVQRIKEQEVFLLIR